jgi:hypothetical protein
LTLSEVGSLEGALSQRERCEAFPRSSANLVSAKRGARGRKFD